MQNGSAIRIGVLAYQGSVVEHIGMLRQIDGVEAVEVRLPHELEQIDGIVIPGGESTTIAKLLHVFNLFEPLRAKIEAGLPAWGTCAGMILLAKEICDEPPHLQLMDITVRRNAYGRQLDSFCCDFGVPEFSSNLIPLVFIRAPWVEHVGKSVKVISELDGRVIAARERHMLVTSFHPELTNNLSTHEYFVRMCVDAQRV